MATPRRKIRFNTSKSTDQSKKSHRWITHYQRACDIQKASPDTTIVSIADREGDIHEWFQYAQDVPEESRASYIIRAKANRALEIDEEESEALWDYMNRQKRLDTYRVDVPKRNGQLEREARLDVYASEVRLRGRGKVRKPLSLHVVYAKERHPPEKTKGIEWMLLTDLQVDDAVQARMIIDWYRCRWEIETYFRVIKGSCDIEKSRLRTEGRKLNCIAIYMIISWRLHSITMLSRQNPKHVCTSAFSDQEWTILWRMQHKCDPPKTPPTLYEMARLLAMLGGFLARKGDGEPGVKNIWRGYNKLLHYIEAAQALGL